MSVRIWLEANGLDWQALPLLVEIHGITDVDTLIAELVAIRNFQDSLDG